MKIVQQSSVLYDDLEKILAVTRQTFKKPSSTIINENEAVEEQKEICTENIAVHWKATLHQKTDGFFKKC